MKLSENEKKWIRKKMDEFYSSEFSKEEGDLKERAIERRTRWLIEEIEDENPDDVHSYVDNKLRIEEYDQKLDHLSSVAVSLKPGDEKACDKLREKVEEVLEKAESDFPGFRKERALMISELMGNINAVRTKGFMGSTAMTQDLKKKEKPNQKNIEGGKI